MNDRSEVTIPAAEPNPLPASIAQRLTRNNQGLFCAVVQQHDTGAVLMVAWMDDEALWRTLTTGWATYYSRSRREYWRKGDTSGNRQRVLHVRVDCDGDALLLSVDQTGSACHTGAATCFSGSAAVLTLETGGFTAEQTTK